ncbi:MAG: MBOAT family protein [Clostridiales bacterium]|nr:MBOAT family protein [Clostridiales bacterium]
MLFNSYEFVFMFLPVCLFFYYILAKRGEGKGAKIWLIAMSLWFYGSFRAEYLIILIISILFNYAAVCMMDRVGTENPGRKRGTLTAGIIGNLGLLLYFKYANFFIENINGAFDGELPLLHVLLPIGISFITFQQISFLIDNYRGEFKSCGFLNYMLYIAYFPKLVEGPIAVHSELLPEFEMIGKKRFDAESFMRGICLFVFGMFKKVILADTFGGAVNYGYSNLEMMHSLDAVLLVLFYALQLYFDFSGYCDMAMGVSRMFGIELPINFNSPYKAKNIVDFWKRWHITLNRFFTKYVYIPLGGNREGAFKMYRNLLIIFLLSGLWHGAGWNFILWGMLHGLLYMLTRMWQRKYVRRAENRNQDGIVRLFVRTLSVLCTFIYVSVAWVYFRADSIAQGNELLHLIIDRDFVRVNKDLAGYFNLDEFWYVLKVLHLDGWEFGHYILMFVITASSLFLVFFCKNTVQIAEKIKPRAWSAVVMAGLFLWCVLTFSNVSSFIYFNF